jgi:hypothetical protein
MLAKALRILKEKKDKDGGEQVRSLMEKKLAGETVDIFQDNPLEKQPRKQPPPGGGPAAKGDQQELSVPDHSLVRFIDVTVKPGFKYEYQIQIKTANPNFGKKNEVAWPGLADVKELVSQWSPIIELTVPREVFVYGMEMDDRSTAFKQKTLYDPKILSDREDVTWMQVHRWIETTSLNPDQRGATRPVGDWTVGEVPVRRGEIIGRLEPVKVAMWSPTKENFEIAQPIQATTKPGVIGVRPLPIKGIPVNFATEDVLVDWEGGQIRKSFRGQEKVGDKVIEKTLKDVNENANVEYLILAPDGKLRARSSRTDLNDPDRKERYDEWSKWVEQVEKGLPKPATPGTKPPPGGDTKKIFGN